ncbi:MAG: hypothetical protein ACK5P6_02560 [Pseudobdellovibrionaceae bacterium]
MSFTDSQSYRTSAEATVIGVNFARPVKKFLGTSPNFQDPIWNSNADFRFGLCRQGR